MSKIKSTFESLISANRAALVPFITAGDPDPTQTVAIMHGLVEGGADIIELGVPFSDPMADGPVIQHASERALKHNISLNDVLNYVEEFRKDNQTTPVVLMGYCNPIETLGYEKTAKRAAEVGVDGFLTVDLPPEESKIFNDKLRDNAIDPIFLVAPTSTTARIKGIANSASGFIYYVSLKGVTGSQKAVATDLEEKLSSIREHTDLPVGVGFGIRDAESAARVAKLSDAVVVGSALVSRLADLSEQPEKLSEAAREFMAELRTAIDKARES
jgi:tryptophan synthase alpha chain